MAINLTAAGDGRVSFGDLAGVATRTALSFAGILKPTTAVTTGYRFFSHWGAGSADQNFVCEVIDGDELQVIVSDGAGTYHGDKTTDLNLTSGTTYRIVVTITYGSPVVIHLYVNGIDKTLSSLASNNIATSIDVAGGIEVVFGHDNDAADEGIEGDYAELAIWQRTLTQAQADIYTAEGRYPTCCGPTGLIYLPLTNTSSLTDSWSSVTAVLTDGSNATHPSMTACAGAGAQPFFTSQLPIFR